LSRIAVQKSLLAVVLSCPLLWLLWLISLDLANPGSALGADAGETVVHFLGEWSLIMLLSAYSVSPLRRLTNVAVLARCRRLVGLFAFAYVCIHLFSYVALYLEFEWQTLLEDLVERTYITAGMAAFTCLLLMALTSTKGWQRRLRRNWQRVHMAVYAAVSLALLHLWWLTRDGFTEVALYTLWFLLMSAERLYRSKTVRGWLRDAQ
jgi:sulfoxide reductase heme-binding subunit YedZ